MPTRNPITPNPRPPPEPEPEIPKKLRLCSRGIVATAPAMTGKFHCIALHHETRFFRSLEGFVGRLVSGGSDVNCMGIINRSQTRDLESLSSLVPPNSAALIALAISGSELGPRCIPSRYNAITPFRR